MPYAKWLSDLPLSNASNFRSAFINAANEEIEKQNRTDTNQLLLRGVEVLIPSQSQRGLQPDRQFNLTVQLALQAQWKSAKCLGSV